MTVRAALATQATKKSNNVAGPKYSKVVVAKCYGKFWK